jgi:quercetin dioxygenase-like cupin family protein
MRRRLRATLLATALAVFALAAGPPLVNAITSTLFVVGTLEPVKVNNDGIKLKTRGLTDVHVQEVRFEPGDFVDWHDHPGFALIAVSSGQMTFLDPDCTEDVIGPGEAFVESGGPTFAVNESSTEPALFYVTYVVPEGSPRIVPTDPPRCARGKDKDDDRKDKDDDRKDKDDDRKDKDDDRDEDEDYDDWDHDD